MSRPVEAGHLGEALAGLVDGHLDHATRERALAHLTHCDPCRAEVDGLRRLRARLLDLGAQASPVPAGLADRLLSLPLTGDVTPVRALPPVWVSGPVGAPRPPGRPRGRLHPASAAAVLRRPRVPRAAAAGAALALGLGGVLAIGSPTSRPSRAPEESSATIVQVDRPATGPARAELVRVAVRTGR